MFWVGGGEGVWEIAYTVLYCMEYGGNRGEDGGERRIEIGGSGRS